jgi:hypothetical protein
MSAFPRTRAAPASLAEGVLAAVVLLGAAAIGLLLAAAQPGRVAVGVGALVIGPLTAYVVAGAARAVIVGAALAYFGALVWAYTAYFAPLYAYSGLIDASPPPDAIIVVAALTALPAAWLPIAARRPSTVVLWSLYVVGYVPAAMVPVFLEGRLGAVLPLNIALLASMAVLSLMLRARPAPIHVPSISLTAFTWLLLGLGALSTLYIAATFGIRSPPSLRDVYTTRAEFAATQLGAAAGGYIVPWASNAINPLLMALGIARRRPALVSLGLLGQLLIFADTGYKTVLFSIVLVPLVYTALTLRSRSYGPLVALGTPVILVCSVLAGTLTAQLSLAPALARRTFATPGHVGWYYYEFFSDHPQYHLSHSFLRWFETNPYGADPPLVIGSVYFHTGTDANSNMWGDAYANFGFAGIAAFTVVCGLVLLVVDALGQRRDVRVVGPMLAIAGLSLGSTGLFTTLLTQGLGLGCVLMVLMPPGSRSAEPVDARAVRARASRTGHLARAGP